MFKSLGFVFIVALVALALLGSAAPARAETPTTAEQYCAWVNHQRPVASVFNGLSIYEADTTCARVARIEWRAAVGDPRGNPYVSPSVPGTLGAWAAGIK